MEIDANSVFLFSDAILHIVLAIHGNMKTAVPPATLPRLLLRKLPQLVPVRHLMPARPQPRDLKSKETLKSLPLRQKLAQRRQRRPTRVVPVDILPR